MKKNIISSFIVLLILLMVSIGCNFSVKPQYFKDDIKLATPKVEEAVKLYNENNFEKLYESSHKTIKDQQSKEEAVKLLTQMLERNGKVNKKVERKSKVRLFSQKERVVHFLYDAEFEKTQDILHIAIITNDNKEAQLFGINIYNKNDIEELMKEMERN